MVADRIDPTVVNDSVRQQEPKTSTGVASLFAWYPYSRADTLLPTWGNVARDWKLREYWYAAHNTLVQGAISGLIKRIVSTPYEIKGGRNLTRRYQEMLQNVEFGEGWKTFWTKVLTDYYTQDFGAVIEVIGGGQPDKPIQGGVLGLAQLDRQRCTATGNLEYPIVYYNAVLDGKQTPTMHRMHYTRVIRFIDMPTPIERGYNNGLCALSRCVGIMNAQILMGRYQNEHLSNEPPAGFITFANVRRDYVDAVKAQWSADRSVMGAANYAPYMWLESQDPSNPVDVKVTPLADWPDIGSYREAMETHVNMLALALNEDPQEIWPLTGSALGTGTQSKVLHAKGRAKAYADALTMIERAMNLWILPESLEFSFKYTDAERDQEEALTAQAWVNTINAAPISQEQKLQLMANRIPAFADVLFDEAGNIRLPDDDVIDETTADDATTLQTEETETEESESGASEAASADADIADNSNTRQVTAGALVGSGGRGNGGLSGFGAAYRINETSPEIIVRHASVKDKNGVVIVPGDYAYFNNRVSQAIQYSKDYLVTESDFIRDLSSLITDGLASDVTRRRFGTVMRGMISRYGRQAYKDGLMEGGIEDPELSKDDLATVANLAADASGYVSDFSARVFSGDSQMTPEARAIQWANKTLSQFYGAGQLSADSNGLYEWKYGDAEHCEDCKRLNGQKHRLKEWHAKGWIPKASKLACNGYNCKCELFRTSGRAKGNW